MATQAWIDLPPSSGTISGTVNAKIFDSSGNALTSTGGSLDVNVTGGSITVSNPSVGLVASPIPGSATLTGAKDGSGNLQPLTIVAGALQVGGTVAVTQSTSPWVVSGSVSISNFPATQSVTQGTSPWVVSGTVTANQGTSPWVVSGTVTTSPDVNIHTSSGGNLTATGTALDINVTNATIAVTQSTSPWVVSGTVAATQSGAWSTGRTWTLSSGTDSVSAAISNFPATQSVTQGTSPWVVSGTVSISNFPATVAVTQSTSPWVVSGTVTANIGTTNGLALDATVSGLQVSQGSTTSGQKGALILGAVTTAAPSYTTAQSSPLSLTTVGNLRVDGSSVTQPVSGTVTVNHSDSAPGTQTITVQDTGSTTTAMANGQNFITGTATAGSAASFSLSSYEALEVQVTGTWTGTLSSEISLDGGTTWFTRGVKQAGAAYISSTFTQNFSGGLNVSGMTNYRVRATAAVTGTATVKIVASLNAGSITVSNPMTLRDSTTQSIMSTIKAASTAVAATDTALVVGISQNSSGVSLGTSTGKTNVLQVGTLVTTATTADQVVLTYTVTNGKTFYLQWFDITCFVTTATGSILLLGTVSLETPSGSKVWTQRIDNSLVNQYYREYPEPLPISSGTVVRLVTTPGASTSYTWHGNIHGYEK